MKDMKHNVKRFRFVSGGKQVVSTSWDMYAFVKTLQMKGLTPSIKSGKNGFYADVKWYSEK